MTKFALLASAVVVAMPSLASAQFIGTDGIYNLNRTTGNTFTSIVGQAGTTTITTSGDDLSFAVTFAAPFTYYGSTTPTANFSTNGLITFGGTNTAFTNTALTATNPTLPSIAPYWDDLNFNVAGDPTRGMYQRNVGTVTTVEYHAAPYFGGPTTAAASFQIVFDSANSSVRFNYIDVTSTPAFANDLGASATIGIKGVSTFVQAGFNTSGTANDGDSIIATLVPAPGGLALLGLAGLVGKRRRRA